MNLTEDALAYLNRYNEKRRAEENHSEACKAFNTATELLDKAEDVLTEHVGANIPRRAIAIEGVTVLVELRSDDRRKVTVLDEEGEVR